MPPALDRRSLLTSALVFCIVGPATASSLSKEAAVEKAEAFIAKNGYTDLRRDLIELNLDPESLELSDNREKRLADRFSTLRPKAIGIKKGARGSEGGWSVCFDYVRGGSASRGCRVVTMDDEGNNLVVQHVDGIRADFVGFD